MGKKLVEHDGWHTYYLEACIRKPISLRRNIAGFDPRKFDSTDIMDQEMPPIMPRAVRGRIKRKVKAIEAARRC